MPRSPIVRRSLRSARAATALATLLLVLATAAAARPMEGPILPRKRPAPTIVKEIVTQPQVSGPSTIVSVLIGLCAGAALSSASCLFVARRTKLRDAGADTARAHYDSGLNP